MLTRLKRLLGWEAEGRRTAGHHAAGGQRAAIRPKTASQPARRPKKPKTEEPDMTDLLGAPSLSLDTSETGPDGFDPYNTGVFDRSASWDRISKNNR